MRGTVPKYGYFCLCELVHERYGSVAEFVAERYAADRIDAELDAALADVLECEARYLGAVR
jgi:hypothetical protein